MKFDFVIGNPPYQIEAGGTSTSDKPVYHLFMDAASKISDKVELITPARFLFDAGATPKAWNNKMLNSPHFKILKYYGNSADVFNNVGIAGGVAISYIDAQSIYKPIEIFTSYNQLNSILQKVKLKMENDKSVEEIIFVQNKFNLDELNNIISDLNRTDKRLESNIFSLRVFTENKNNEDDLRVLGLNDGERCFRYVKRSLIDQKSENLYKYKVVLPKSYGTGILMDKNNVPMIGTPVILNPGDCYTRTFIGFGKCDTYFEAENIFKYLKTRFSRTMLGILKVTQDNNPGKWKYVPLQDFTPDSDIDWSKSIKEIDKQLYEKYDLSEEEINFIETKVKEME